MIDIDDSKLESSRLYDRYGFILRVKDNVSNRQLLNDLRPWNFPAAVFAIIPAAEERRAAALALGQ